MTSQRPLPDGWRWAALSELLAVADVGVWGDADPQNGARVLRSTNFRDDGTIDYSDVAIRDIPMQRRLKARLEPGDILLERSGKAGRVCMFNRTGDEYVFGNFCQRLRADADICHQPFLFWYLHFLYIDEATMEYSRGTTIQNLHYKRYIAQPIPLPPLDRQRRIADLMATAERARSAAAAQLASIEALTAALLRRQFEGSPAASLRARGWRSFKLRDVCRIMNGSTPKSSVAEYWNGDICWITPADLGSLATPYIEGSARMITQAGYESCSTTLVPPGTVIISSRAPIGHIGIAKAPTCTNQGCKSLVPSETIDSQFLYWRLRYSMDDLRALGAGATFTEVSKRTMAAFPILVPPLDEQRRIADLMGTAERARAASAAQLVAIEVLAGALLRRAFAEAA